MGPHSNVGGHAARVIGVIATLALAVFLVIGCGETDTLDPTPSLLATVPVDGSEVAEGDIVTVIFDLDSGIVTVNGAAAQGGGVTRTFQVADHGVQSISWGDGSTATLGYDVTPVDVTPADLVDVAPYDVRDRTAVDPFDVQDGLMLVFSEPVDVIQLTLLSEAIQEIWLPYTGGALDWVATADGNTITLNANPADPIFPGTRYDVVGCVVDRAGHVTSVAFWFETYIEPA